MAKDCRRRTRARAGGRSLVFDRLDADQVTQMAALGKAVLGDSCGQLGQVAAPALPSLSQGLG
ncbi:hypothetical protein [Pseudarthrobacter sp. S9]|uniref:hypothetical protein n=1 Tax=Pseudarthrobacter sp. S9 TaxID=3418421 RepID=UPI003CFC7180